MEDNKWLLLAWNDIIEKIKVTSAVIGDQFPSMTAKGKYIYTEDSWRWVTGFWPGLLWLLYEDTRYKPFEDIALSCENKMYESLVEYIDLHHDVGFMWLLTSIKRYKMTGDLEARKRGLIAASHLSSRFNFAGNFLVAWNTNNVNDADVRGLSIIDSMMNLPLLYWASDEINDPRFSHIANAHATTVLKHFIREDGSVNHMVEFNPFSGEMIQVKSGQGYSTSSAWSRGTSWALHGMALAYKHTNKTKYLDATIKVAEFFINELPEDNVPYWDFRAPIDENIPRDTSAGACAACGLIELSNYVGKKDKDRYRNVAVKIVKSMYENYGNWNNDNEGLLRGGTFNYPIGQGIDVSLIYGDYYFVEAISRLKDLYKN